MNQVALFQKPGAVSTLFANQTVEDLGAGVTGGYAVIGYRGKVWSIKHAGNEQQLMRDDGDGPRGSIEVVMVKAASVVSKIYYDGGYVEGSNTPPTCFSTNGQTPDGTVQNKQAATCATCPHNAWGSRITDSGKNGKACADSKRIAVVPTGDIDNEVFGGPMLLRVPAASLKDVKTYGEVLQSYGFPYFAVSTRIAFDPQDAYPHFVLTAVEPLNDEQARKVLAMREDPRVARILSESEFVAAPAGAPAPTSAPAVAKTPFERPAASPASPPPAQSPSTVQQAPQAAPRPAPAPAAAQVSTPTAPAQQVSPATSASPSKAGGFGPMAPVGGAPAVTQPAVQATPPTKTTRAPRKPPAAAPAAQAQVQEPQVQAQEPEAEQAEGTSPGAFDDMLDDLLK